MTIGEILSRHKHERETADLRRAIRAAPEVIETILHVLALPTDEFVHLLPRMHPEVASLIQSCASLAIVGASLQNEMEKQ